MQALIDSLSCILQWIGDSFTQVFVDAFELVTDLGVFLFDAAGDIVVDFINSLDMTQFLEITSIWNTLPPQAIQVIAAIGLHQAVGIIIAAIVIRFILQLIPFVRLGS